MATPIADLVDLAVALDSRIADDQKRLKALKKQLLAEAKRRKPQPIEDGGKRVVLSGTNGSISRVVWPKPKLTSGITTGSKTYDAIVSLAPDVIGSWLFDKKPVSYMPTDDFRRHVKEIYRDDPGFVRKLIALCTSKSSPTVSFETKRNPEHTS